MWLLRATDMVLLPDFLFQFFLPKSQQCIHIRLRVQPPPSPKSVFLVRAFLTYCLCTLSLVCLAPFFSSSLFRFLFLSLSLSLSGSFFSFTFMDFRLSLPALLFFPRALGVFSQVFVWGDLHVPWIFSLWRASQPADQRPAL